MVRKRLFMKNPTISLALLCSLAVSSILSSGCKHEGSDMGATIMLLMAGGSGYFVNQYTFTPPESGFYYNSPTITGDALYIATSRKWGSTVSNQNRLYKLNLSLEEQWSYDLGSAEAMGAAALDSFDNVYVTVMEGRVDDDLSAAQLFIYSISSDGSSLRFKEPISSIGNLPTSAMYNVAISSGNVIYAPGERLYAYNTAGAEQWNYPLPSPTINDKLTNAPIIDDDGNIYL